MPDRIIGGTALHWSLTDELLNVGTKSLLALALLFGALGVADRDIRQRSTPIHLPR